MISKYRGWSASETINNWDTEATVHLQANFESTAEPYTIQFGVTTPDPSDNINPIADIVWTVEGNEVRRTVSVINGLSVTGTGQAVRVEVYEEHAAFPGEVDSVNYNVSILVTPGCRASTQQPPTLHPVLTDPATGDRRIGTVWLATGTQYTFPAPHNAGIISLYTLVQRTALLPGIAPVIITDAQAQVTLTGANSRASYSPLRGEWVPVVPGLTDVTLTNVSGVDLEFHVAFGVDG